MIKIAKYVTEYIVLPFPDIQPDYLLKVELWKTHHGYHPIIYIKDKFRLSESSLCGYKKHIKNYNIWVEDQWGIFPENCSVKIENENEAMDIIFEVIKCNILKVNIKQNILNSLYFHNENL